MCVSGNKKCQFFRKFCARTLHKKWSFPLRISSVNVTISSGNWMFPRSKYYFSSGFLLLNLLRVYKVYVFRVFYICSWNVNSNGNVRNVITLYKYMMQIFSEIYVIKHVLQNILKICICIKQYVLHTYYIFATDTSVIGGCSWVIFSEI